MIYINTIQYEPCYFLDGAVNMRNVGRYITPYEDVCITWKYENDNEFIIVSYIVNWIRDTYTNTYIYLELPYVPYAKMDKIPIEENECFALKYFCNMINSLNFDSIFILEAHSDICLALLNHSFSRICNFEYNIENSIMFYPNISAVKRYANNIKLPYAFTDKILDFKLQGVDVKNKNIIIRDDICSAGKDIYYVTKTLKEAGAKDIYLVVPHLEENIHFEDNCILNTDLIKHTFTTDTIYRHEYTNKVTIIDFPNVINKNNKYCINPFY